MKALEQMKALKKDQMVEIKLDKERITNTTIHKEKAIEVLKNIYYLSKAKKKNQKKRVVNQLSIN